LKQSNENNYDSSIKADFDNLKNEKSKNDILNNRIRNTNLVSNPIIDSIDTAPATTAKIIERLPEYSETEFASNSANMNNCNIINRVIEPNNTMPNIKKKVFSLNLNLPKIRDSVRHNNSNITLNALHLPALRNSIQELRNSLASTSNIPKVNNQTIVDEQCHLNNN